MAFRFRNKKHRRPLVAPQRFRPRLEPLEDRRLLAAAPLHVDIASTAPAPDGLAWATAYVSLQDALDRAAVLNNDTNTANDIDQIWIAEGTYTPTALYSANEPRSATFSLVDGVSLVGGFAGTETGLDQREPAINGRFPHETILSGDLAGDDAPDVATADLLDDATRKDNATVVVKAFELNAPIGLDGLTITGGCGSGGIDNDSSTLTVTNSIISGNAAGRGGGIRSYYGALTVTNSTIADNLADQAGAGISTYGGTLTVANSTISGNVAGWDGGGIFNSSGSAMTVTNSIVSGNSAKHGGGISNYTGTSTVTNSTISGNLAGGNGAGIFAYFATSTVTNSIISGNLADGSGGGIDNFRGVLTVTNSTISGNAAGSNGGGIYNFRGSATVANSIIAINHAFSSDHNVYGTLEPESSFNLIDVDPGFVEDPEPGADNIWGTADDVAGDLHLRGDSPAIDAGDQSLLPADTVDLDRDGDTTEPIPFDLAGGPRVDGDEVDIGAYEFFAGAPEAVITTTAVYGEESTVVSFDGTGSRPYDKPLTYLWQIDLDGNGSFDDPGDLVSTDASFEHTFTDSGSYGVRLTVSYDEYSDTATGSITLLPPILFVDADAMPGGDGAAWDSAFDSLQAALGLAASRNTDIDGANDVTSIWIAEGTYRPRALSGTDPRSATFSLVDGLSLIGGFAGTETSLDQREPATDGSFPHETILSGDLAGDDAPDVAVANLLDDLTRDDNAYRVVTAVDLSEPISLDRLTITGGNGSSSSGGGIYINSSTMTVIDATISGNAAGNGGGIDNSGGTLTVTNSTIAGNAAGAYGSGGGIYSAYGMTTVANSTIADNVAYEGGGICNSASGTLTIADSSIVANSAKSGAGIYGYWATTIVTESTISDNAADDDGGGIYSTYGTSTVTNSTISGNAAGNGGGIYNTSGTSTVANSTISNNAAHGNGGGIYNDDPGEARNTIIAGNAALDGGPDVYRKLSDTSSHNLIGDGSGMSGIANGVNGNLVGTATDPIDPRLGPLGDLGGPTWTMPLLAGSPAIDAGEPEIAQPPETDQRGLQRIADGDGNGQTRIDIGAFEFGASVSATEVLARHILYHNSALDGDAAIATGKRALLPGEAASFANYTSYNQGINGIVVDIAALSDPDGLSTADFLFRVGNDSDPSGWASVANSAAVTVQQEAGTGSSDRVTITWPDRSIVNQWLQVTVKANDNTGLSEDDVFYFGNAVGEAGDQPNNAIVNATDEIVARNFQHSAVDRALVDDPYDYNRDGLVNATDQIIARENQTHPLTMLRLITPPVSEAAAAGDELSVADVDWLHQFEQTTAKRQRTEISAVEQAVDRLLAVGVI